MAKRNIIVVTNLYPNLHEPNRGIFIKQLMDNIALKANVRVVAPVPWQPKWFEKRANNGDPVPEKEFVNGIEVFHPRYFVIPKILRGTYGWFFYKGIRSLIRKLHAQLAADFISAHWVYPDGYATVKVAEELKVPVAVHALGCDINEYTKYENRKKRIVYALSHSDLNLVKSSELKRKITALGIESNKIYVVPNGVNKAKFSVSDTIEARQALGLDTNQSYALFIGNFQVEKGLTYLLDAVALCRDIPFKLIVIGGGRQEKQMRTQITELDISDKVQLIGRVPHEVIPQYMSAANLLCLPSLREGCPNVVLESLSCGTPVLGSRVGAVPDIITNDAWGIMVEPKSSQAIAEALPHALTLKNAGMPKFEWIDWQENATKVLDIFEQLLQRTKDP